MLPFFKPLPPSSGNIIYEQPLIVSIKKFIYFKGTQGLGAKWIKEMDETCSFRCFWFKINKNYVIF